MDELGRLFSASFAVGYKQPVRALNLCGFPFLIYSEELMNSSNHIIQKGYYNSFNNILGSSGRRCGSISSFPFLAICKSVENVPCSSVSFAVKNIKSVSNKLPGLR